MENPQPKSKRRVCPRNTRTGARVSLTRAGGWRSATTACRRSSPVLLVQVLHHRLGARVDTELVENVFDVAMHRPDADPERLGDFLIHVPLGHQIEHLFLTV